MKNPYLFFFLIPIVLLGSPRGAERTAQAQALESAEIEAQIDALVEQMTPAEKYAQMMMLREDYVTPEDITTMGYGAILIRPTRSARPDVDTAVEWADLYDGYAQGALDSRLGVPLLIGVDAVHGHALAIGATVFPHNVGLGATDDPELLRQMGAAVADEIRATGCNWILGPAVSVSRDIRWGRTYEGWGESPDTQVGKTSAFIEGVQAGGSLPVTATAKHFIADGGSVWGTGPRGIYSIDQGDAIISEEKLRAIHLPPYLEAIDAGVGSIMVSYGKWNGVECHHSKYLLTDLLKDELGFDGFIVSDATGFYESGQDFSERVLSACNAGIDLFMLTSDDLWDDFLPALTQHVNDGAISMDRIDDAVRRILRIKIRHGLFDNPLAERTLTNGGALGAAAHRDVSLQLVQKSQVLLTNRNGTIPLDKTAHVAVVGNMADDIGVQCGGWTVEWAGLRDAESAVLTGSSILDGVRAIVEPAGGTVTAVESLSEVPDADVAVYVTGEYPYAEWFGDRRLPGLIPNDVRDITELQLRGIPTVVVILGGRPLYSGLLVTDWDAAVIAWLPGTEGQGVADCLFGDAPYTGKLSHSWPFGGDELPSNFDEEPYNPVFPFQYGLSTLSVPELSPVELPHAYVGESFGAQLVASNVGLVDAWRVSRGALPDGIQLSATGELTGTPTVAGVYPVVLEAEGPEGVTASQSYLLQVRSVESYDAWADAITWQQPEDAARDRDPDGDFLANQFEYLSGGDPLVADAPADLNFTLTTAGSRYTAEISLPLSDPAYADDLVPQYSRNLRDWVRLTDAGTTTIDEQLYFSANSPSVQQDQPIFLRFEPEN